MTDWAAYRNLHVHIPNVTVHRTVVHRDNFYYYIYTEHMEIKKIIVIFSITLLCNGQVKHNVNSLLKMILSKQILDQDMSTAPGMQMMHYQSQGLLERVSAMNRALLFT